MILIRAEEATETCGGGGHILNVGVFEKYQVCPKNWGRNTGIWRKWLSRPLSRDLIMTVSPLMRRSQAQLEYNYICFLPRPALFCSTGRRGALAGQAGQHLGQHTWQQGYAQSHSALNCMSVFTPPHKFSRWLYSLLQLLTMLYKTVKAERDRKRCRPDSNLFPHFSTTDQNTIAHSQSFSN